MSTQGYSASKLVLFRANIVIAITLGLAIFGFANYFSNKYYRHFDWTSQRYYSLSDKTKQVLAGLQAPLKITVLLRGGRLAGLMNNLLDEYKATNPQKVEIKTFNPTEQSESFVEVVKRLNVERESIVVEYGDQKKHLGTDELAEFNYDSMRMNMGMGGAPKLKNFKGEQALTSAILTLVNADQPVIYVLQGHGEASVEGYDEGGLSSAAEVLRKENFKVQALEFKDELKVPDDCDALLLAGPQYALPEQHAKAVESYLAGGGRALIGVDPMIQHSEKNSFQTRSGLESLLERWGVKLKDDIAVQADRTIFGTILNIRIGTAGWRYHELTKALQKGKLYAEFNAARGVELMSPMPSSASGQVILDSREGSWAETSNVFVEKEFRPEPNEAKGPFPIAVAVTGTDLGDLKGSRLVVVGDSDFLQNHMMDPRNTAPGNQPFLSNALYWLLAKENLIALPPKETKEYTLFLTPEQENRLFWLSIFGIPSFWILLGGIVWLRRRD